MPEKVIAKVDYSAAIDSKIVDSRSKNAKTEVEQIGINVPLMEADDINKVVTSMKSTRKPVEFVIKFDDTGFSYFARVGPQKFPLITTLKINIDSRITDKEKVYKKLIDYGAATQALVTAHKKKSPDQSVLGPLRQQITDLENKIKDDQRKLTDLRKQFTDNGGK